MKSLQRCPSQLAAMGLIVENLMTRPELARAMGITPQSATAIVERLLKRGLVRLTGWGHILPCQTRLTEGEKPCSS